MHLLKRPKQLEAGVHNVCLSFTKAGRRDLSRMRVAVQYVRTNGATIRSKANGDSDGNHTISHGDVILTVGTSKRRLHHRDVIQGALTIEVSSVTGRAIGTIHYNPPFDRWNIGHDGGDKADSTLQITWPKHRCRLRPR